MPVPLVAIQSPWITPDSLLWLHSIWQVDCRFGKYLACLPTQRKCSELGALALARRGLSASMLISSVQWTYSTFWRCFGSAGRSQSLSTWQRTWGQHTAIPASVSATTALCMTSISYPSLCMMSTKPWISGTSSPRRWTQSFWTGGKQLLEPHLMARERWWVETKAWWRRSSK